MRQGQHGEGKSFSPTDLVAGTALGTCMLTIMGIRQQDEPGSHGTTVKVVKEMVTAPVRRIANADVNSPFPVKTTEEQQTKLRNAP